MSISSHNTIPPPPHQPKSFVQIGDLVYARLTVANKDMEPEIECIDGTTCVVAPAS